MRYGLLAATGLACWLSTQAMAATALPPAEDGATARLNSSPRHGEFVKIDSAAGPLRTWVVYPERKDKAPVVIVIHEIFGLTDWIRAVADQLAADGFIAVAPDLLSGKGTGGGGTETFGNRDAAVEAVSNLSRDEVLARLGSARRWAHTLLAADGHVASIGFCWGGATSFAFATTTPPLDGAVVYYGTPPSDLSTVHAPVVGFYGGDDARVDVTIDATRAKMQELGKSYVATVYEGAGHGFLRAQAGSDANRRAAEQAWPATLAFLREHTK